MFHQRQQPTIKALREVVDEWYHMESPPAKMQDFMLSHFQSASAPFVLEVFHAVHSRREFDKAYLEHMCNIILVPTKREDAGEGGPKRSTRQSRPQQFQAWATYNHQLDVDNLSWHHALEDATKVVLKSRPLAQQCLSVAMARGYQAAIQRSLLQLVFDLSDELPRAEKTASRRRLVGANSLLESGEDIDMERPFQALPLPTQWLRAQGFTFDRLSDPEWLLKIQSHLKQLADKFRKPLVNTDSPLSPGDADYDEAAAYLATQTPVVSKALQFSVAPTHRLKTKSSIASQQYVLTVLALAMWIRQTEEWHFGEEIPNVRLSMASNLSPLMSPSLSHAIEHERRLSSQPLTDHLCAMCGKLFPPLSPDTQNSAHIGNVALHADSSDDPCPHHNGMSCRHFFAFGAKHV